MTPWQVLIVVVVWAVTVVAGYLLGRRKGRAATGVWLTVILSVPGLVILALCLRRGTAEKKVTLTPDPDFVQQRLAAIASIKPEWDETAAQTESWIWRLPRELAHASEGAANKRGPHSPPLPRGGDVSSRSTAQTRAGAGAAADRPVRRSACSPARSR